MRNPIPKSERVQKSTIKGQLGLFDPKQPSKRRMRKVARNMSRLPGNVPEGLEARAKFLKRKGHPMAGQYLEALHNVRKANKTKQAVDALAQ
jgi:hypothetical protein